VNEPKPLSATARVDALDWPRLQDDLNEVGHARTAELLDPAACRALRAMFDEPRWFRSTVDMTRHRFGSGLPTDQGHAIVFTTIDRPVPSARGWRAAPMKHGVSTIRRGSRATLGLIFHDAE